MTRGAQGVACALAAATLVAVTCGGGGRDPLVGIAWQLAALVLLGVAASLPAPRASRGLAVSVAVLALVVIASALQADRVEPSLRQALAWLLALAPAVALARVRARPDGEGPTRAAIAWASAALLAVQLAGLLGLPLGGRAGAPDPAGRPLGTFMDPNHLAAALCLVAAINAPQARRPRDAHALVAALAAGAALMTRGRIAVVAIAALAVAEAWRRRGPARWSRKLVAAVVLVLATAGLALAVTMASRRGEADAWARPAIWRGALPAVAARPALGLGPAGFQSEWPRWQEPVERGLSRHAKLATTPHGEWLRVPIELGLLGLAALAALAVALRRRLGARARDAVPALAAAAPILLVHDAFHSPAFVAWLAAGLAMALPPPDDATVAVPARSGDASRPPAAALLGMAVVAAAVVSLGLSRARLDAWHRTSDPRRLSQALASDPRDVEALVAAAEALAPPGPRMTPRDLRAVLLADEAARRAPRDAEAALLAARLHERARRDLAPGPVRGVAALYERACRLAPSDAACRAEQARVLADASDDAGALLAADAALAIEPHLAQAGAWRVIALQRLGREDEAAAERSRVQRDLARAGDPSLSPYERSLLAIDPDLERLAGLTGR